MSTQCIRAQEILSQALDREPMDAALFAEARAHCQECADCAAFARGLALIRRAPVPSPGAELADSVIRAIHAVAAEAASADAVPADAGALAPASSPAASATPLRGMFARVKGLGGADLWKVGAWTGAAAAVILIAGFAAVSGVRSILTPTTTQDVASLTKGEEVANGFAGEDAERSAADSAAGSLAAPAAPSEKDATFIEVNGIAYRYVGIVEIPRSSLTTAGSTTTSLDTGAAAQSYTVYATTTTGRVALLSAGGTRVFELVERRYQGRTYVLTSEALSGFGEWPGLPETFTPPTTSDGAPTFMKADPDELGVQPYLLPGTPIEQGFAIAPNTSSGDPAMGNPNWTWWVTPQ